MTIPTFARPVRRGPRAAPLLALGLLEEAKLLEAANRGGPRAHAAAKRGIALAEELGMRGVLQRAT